MLDFLKKVTQGDPTQQTLKKYKSRVESINALEEDISQLSDQDLQKKTIEFKEKISEGVTLDELLPETFAVVRETAKRVSDTRHFDVQLIGGMAIHEGNISEMRTGEGKTLVSTSPVYLNALSGKGVHVVTVNDYLAERDAVWMGQIHHFLGLSVGVITQGGSYLYDPAHTDQGEDEERDTEGSYKVVHEFLRPCTRPEAYQADITYGTNSEFGFDYLRDNIEYEKKNLRQRELHFAVIDEIDSILIDEARTPLIISAPANESENLYEVFARIVKAFKAEEDYTLDEKLRAVQVTELGMEKAEKALGIDNIYTDKGIKNAFHLETAVRAQALYTKDQEYVVRNNEVIIVDQNTGRLQPGRRWSDGMHQAVEAKEGVAVQKESRTFASVTYQNFFRMYGKISGMTGTASTSSEEFFKVYGLNVVEIPTNKPVARIDNSDLIFQTTNGKFQAIAAKIKEVHETGQPVLVGTISVEQNELLASFLQKEGVPHNVLNAKNHENEGNIVAGAGEKGAVTIATNMAGRGVDIKLGGVPYEVEKAQEVRDLGGLFVLGTERHDARRIDNQLRGRSGRQGDPGETQFYVSVEDKLMRVFGSERMQKMMATLNIPEDQAIQNGLITKSLENAQTRIEGVNFDARKQILDYDNVLNTQRASMYERRRAILLGEQDDLDHELAGLVDHEPKFVDEINKKKEELGEDVFYEVFRRLMLQSIDTEWIDHLETMDYVRSQVALRAYGQRDPLIEYKKEGLRLFTEMSESMEYRVREVIPHIQKGALQQEEERMKETVKKAKMISSETENSDSNTHSSDQPKIGRNELVTIIKDGEEQEMKYKKAEKLLEEGWSIKK